MALLSIQLYKLNIRKLSLKLSSLLLPKYNPSTCSVGCNLQILFGSLYFSSSLLLPLWSRLPLPELEQWPCKYSTCSHSPHWSQYELCHPEASMTWRSRLWREVAPAWQCTFNSQHSFVLWNGSTKSFKKFP